MPLPELCTETEVAELAAAFYARVRADVVLGPVFERHVADWNRPMPKRVAFWSTALCGPKSYCGDPMLQREPDRMPASLPRRAAKPRSVPVPQ